MINLAMKNKSPNACSFSSSGYSSQSLSEFDPINQKIQNHQQQLPHATNGGNQTILINPHALIQRHNPLHYQLDLIQPSLLCNNNIHNSKLSLSDYNMGSLCTLPTNSSSCIRTSTPATHLTAMSATGLAGGLGETSLVDDPVNTANSTKSVNRLSYLSYQHQQVPNAELFAADGCQFDKKIIQNQTTKDYFRQQLTEEQQQHQKQQLAQQKQQKQQQLAKFKTNNSNETNITMSANRTKGTNANHYQEHNSSIYKISASIWSFLISVFSCFNLFGCLKKGKQKNGDNCETSQYGLADQAQSMHKRGYKQHMQNQLQENQKQQQRQYQSKQHRPLHYQLHHQQLTRPLPFPQKQLKQQYQQQEQQHSQKLEFSQPRTTQSGLLNNSSTCRQDVYILSNDFYKQMSSMQTMQTTHTTQTTNNTAVSTVGNHLNKSIYENTSLISNSNNPNCSLSHSHVNYSMIGARNKIAPIVPIIYKTSHFMSPSMPSAAHLTLSMPNDRSSFFNEPHLGSSTPIKLEHGSSSSSSRSHKNNSCSANITHAYVNPCSAYKQQYMAAKLISNTDSDRNSQDLDAECKSMQQRHQKQQQQQQQPEPPLNAVVIRQHGHNKQPPLATLSSPSASSLSSSLSSTSSSKSAKILNASNRDQFKPKSALNDSNIEKETYDNVPRQGEPEANQKPKAKQKSELKSELTHRAANNSINSITSASFRLIKNANASQNLSSHKSNLSLNSKVSFGSGTDRSAFSPTGALSKKNSLEERINVEATTVTNPSSSAASIDANKQFISVHEHYYKQQHHSYQNQQHQQHQQYQQQHQHQQHQHQQHQQQHVELSKQKSSKTIQQEQESPANFLLSAVSKSIENEECCCIEINANDVKSINGEHITQISNEQVTSINPQLIEKATARIEKTSACTKELKIDTNANTNANDETNYDNEDENIEIIVNNDSTRCSRSLTPPLPNKVCNKTSQSNSYVIASSASSSSSASVSASASTSASVSALSSTSVIMQCTSSPLSPQSSGSATASTTASACALASQSASYQTPSLLAKISTISHSSPNNALTSASMQVCSAAYNPQFGTHNSDQILGAARNLVQVQVANSEQHNGKKLYGHKNSCNDDNYYLSLVNLTAPSCAIQRPQPASFIDPPSTNVNYNTRSSQTNDISFCSNNNNFVPSSTVSRRLYDHSKITMITQEPQPQNNRRRSNGRAKSVHFNNSRASQLCESTSSSASSSASSTISSANSNRSSSSSSSSHRSSSWRRVVNEQDRMQAPTPYRTSQKRQLIGRSSNKMLRCYLRKACVSNPEVYEDYLCDKEVESYFDNPVYFDCVDKRQQVKYVNANDNCFIVPNSAVAPVSVMQNQKYSSSFSNGLFFAAQQAAAPLWPLINNKHLNLNDHYVMKPIKVDSFKCKNNAYTNRVASRSLSKSMLENGGNIRRLHGESYC
jgi:hypothetical protein